LIRIFTYETRVTNSASYYDKCEQDITRLHKVPHQTPAVEKFLYSAGKSTVTGRHFVAKLPLYKNQAKLEKMGFPLSNFTHREDPSQFVIVTAADRQHFHGAMDAIASFQSFLPNNSIYFYDISGGALNNMVDKVCFCVGNMYMYCKQASVFVSEDITECLGTQ